MQKKKKDNLNLHIYGIHLLNPYKTVVSHLNSDKQKHVANCHMRPRNRPEMSTWSAYVSHVIKHLLLRKRIYFFLFRSWMPEAKKRLFLV